MKIILCLALGLVLLSSSAWMWGAKPSAPRQQRAADIARVRNEGLIRQRHREHIESAKEQGKNEVIFPGGVDLPTPQQSLEELLRDYGLFRVKVIDKETTVYEPYADIDTWYKVEIVETLHQQSKIINDEPLSNEPPSQLLPLLPSESLLVVQAGTITVDGVKVVKRVSSEGNHFILQEEYLIVGYLDCGGKLIRPSSGRAGVFKVKNGHFKSFGQKEHRLVREIQERYNDDLNLLRSDIQSRLRREN